MINEFLDGPLQMTEPPPPPQRQRTPREMILQALAEGPLSARDLSQRVGLSEREVTGHLRHLQKSLKNSARRLQLTPPRCLDCCFVFQKRERLTRPGRCPVCRSTHLSEPLFSLF
ncbi:MAG: ArsR family transcriptional regulator [Desulfuromonadales bacterium]